VSDDAPKLEERRRRAAEELELGLDCQRRGEFDEASRHYRASIRWRPTADAHTYLGWAMSFQGRYGEAIRECETAIALDPDFGNPYNDIGVYLMKLGRYDEAVPWLKRAATARRYEPRHFPHINLARIYERKGDLTAAVRELEKAIGYQPEDRGLRVERHRLLARLN
jgi:Tfp pilus assembly protein PilF